MKRSAVRLFLGLCATLVLAASPARAVSFCASGPPVCFAAPGDRVCSNDNTKQCQANGDCPGGTCNAPSVLAIGGSVTANPLPINAINLADATNLTLLKSTLPSGVVTFRVFPTNPALNASGEILAFDPNFNSCAVTINFRIRAAGAASNETVCPLGELYSLDVISSPVSPAGTTACASYLPRCSDVLPVNYDYLSDSRILAVRSPIAGVVEQELTRVKTFIPSMRMMFARSVDSGVTFTPFTDITTSVTPGSTKIRGTPQWSDTKTVGVNFTGGTGAGTVPTLGEWGLILMTLLLVGASTTLLLRRGVALAGNGSLAAPGPPIFAAGPYLRALAAAAALALAADAAFALAGRPPGGTDVLGSLVAAAIVAYIAHVWVAVRSRTD